MAAMNRPTEATYTVHEEVTVDTADHEDHTFCGIMFPVKCKELLPLDHVVIQTVAVRGRLGPLTVWVSNEDDEAHGETSFQLNPRHWTKIYQRTHGPSFRTYCTLNLGENSIRLSPGQVRVIYIHSTLPGDEAIVYDNRHGRRTYDDALVSVLPGRAHVSERPFGTRPIWGWGNAWRDSREFVGRLNYGAVYKLWNPDLSRSFGSKFQALTRALFLCQRRYESPISRLPDDVIFYILNMCRWDWANDTQEEMKQLKRRKRALAAALQRQQEQDTLQLADAEMGEAGSSDAPPEQQERSASSCCHRSAAGRQDSDDDVQEEDEDDEEYIQPDEVDSDGEFYEDQNGVRYRVVGAVEEDEDDEDDEVDDDDDEEDDDDDDDDDEDYYANHHENVFSFRDDDSDAEEDPTADHNYQRAWFRRQFARVHVLQALASLEDQDAVHMNF